MTTVQPLGVPGPRQLGRGTGLGPGLAGAVIREPGSRARKCQRPGHVRAGGARAQALRPRVADLSRPSPLRSGVTGAEPGFTLSEALRECWP